jgi:prevent-host-death family protein
MKVVNVHEAKTNLSRLLDEVASGKQVIIGKYGKPVARLVSLDVSESAARHRLGALKGKIKIAKGFDEPLGAGAKGRGEK